MHGAARGGLSEEQRTDSGHRRILYPGLIAARLAEVSSSSAVMECGYVVYAVEAKREMLGVSQRTIDNSA